MLTDGQQIEGRRSSISRHRLQTPEIWEQVKKMAFIHRAHQGGQYHAQHSFHNSQRHASEAKDTSAFQWMHWIQKRRIPTSHTRNSHCTGQPSQLNHRIGQQLYNCQQPQPHPIKFLDANELVRIGKRGAQKGRMLSSLNQAAIIRPRRQRTTPRIWQWQGPCKSRQWSQHRRRPRQGPS